MNKKEKEARRYAKNIIQKAREEQNRLLSELELLRLIRIEADRIKKQLIEECSELKRKVKEEVKAIRESEEKKYGLSI